MDFNQAPYTPALLYMASQGQPLSLAGDNLMWVQTLLRGGYIRAEVVPSDNATQLVCKLTPKGEAFLKWLAEP